MGTRFKVFESTGLAPNGRLYAGDLNQIQDSYADQSNLSQEIGVAALTVGETSLKMIRYGPGEARVTGAMRTDGIFRGLGGLYAGAFTTAQRDAIPAGQRPYGLMTLNTTTNRYEWNSNTDASPSWVAIAPTLGSGSISGSMIQANSIDSSKIVDGAVTYADLEGNLKPTVSAAGGTEALRAIGGGAGQVCAGNDARLSDMRTPLDNSVTNAKIVAGAGIPYSKLSLANSITNADVAAGAGIVYSKLNVAGSITAADVAAGYKDGAAATPSMRTLGTGSAQACAGDDARLTNTRTPTDGSVTNAKLADNSVTAAKIADGNVTAAEIADGNVTGVKIQDGAVSVNKILDGHVTNPKLQDGAVSNSKIGYQQITYDKIAPGVTYMVRAGSWVGSLDQMGEGQPSQAIINFEAPFPNAVLSICLTAGDPNDGCGLVKAYCIVWKNRVQFQFVLMGFTGTWDIQHGNTRVDYIATGY